MCELLASPVATLIESGFKFYPLPDSPDRMLTEGAKSCVIPAVQEPFVSGVPEMINDLVKDIANARQGFRMLFSSAPFPGFQRKLEWVRTEFGGNWYRLDEPPTEGWLCPAMFLYFKVAPAELYVKAEEIK